MNQTDQWDAKNRRVYFAFLRHGPEAAVILQTAFHLSADYHAALARMHEHLGYDAGLRSEIERFGITHSL